MGYIISSQMRIYEALKWIVNLCYLEMDEKSIWNKFAMRRKVFLNGHID